MGKARWLPFSYSPKSLEINWKGSPRNTAIRQWLMGHTLTGGQWQAEDDRDLFRFMLCIVSLSMIWKRWWSMLSSVLQVTLKWEAVNILKVRTAIQWDPHRLKEWTSRPLQQGQMQKPPSGKTQPPSRFLAAEQALGVLEHSEFNMSPW